MTPPSPQFDVCGIGSALVDVLVTTTDAVIAEAGLVKGSMQLMPPEEADRVHALVPGGIERSGGSLANSIAGLASLGGSGAMIGRVAADRLGSVFAADMTSVGVTFVAGIADEGSSGRCLILITPDAERTMCTSLGVASHVAVSDLDSAVIADSAVLYLEGYLWDEPSAKSAFRAAIAAAHGAGRQAALTLSDSFCVDRHRDEFLGLVSNDVDIVFGNEAELCSLMGVSSLSAAIDTVRRPGLLVTITRGADGAVVFDGSSDGVVVAPVPGATSVVDTTGAGDLYAAGFLYGLTRGWGHLECASLGNKCAAEIISHVGARPEIELSTLL